MTFAPTPKADLAPLTDLYEGWSVFAQQLLSRLHHAAAAADWAAWAIADIYAHLPGGADAVWQWSGTPAGQNPASGNVSVIITTGNERVITLSKTDSNGGSPAISLSQGSTIVLTDDPATPPITAFRQYVVTSDPVDNGSWVQIDAVRVATFGIQTTPPIGSRVRLLLR